MNHQHGIIDEDIANAIFITYDAKGNPKEICKTLLSLFSLCSYTAKHDPQAHLSLIIALGSKFWDRLDLKQKPMELKPFSQINGKINAPATGGDIHIHIKSNRFDLAFEVAQKVHLTLESEVTLKEEIHGFTYLDSRDLTGFIDGTANPKGEEREEVALISNEDEGFSGGSYVVVQRYVHDLNKWHEIPVSEQEEVFGRTKDDSTQIVGERAKETSHIGRAETHVDGEEQKIVRHSLPYGQASGERGLYFIAYCHSLRTFELMLDRIYGKSDDGLSDRLIEFTKPITGAYFFAPSRSVLEQISKD